MSTTHNWLASQAKTLSKDLPEEGHNVSDADQETPGQASENATDIHAQGRDNVHGVLCNFEQSCRARPVKSVLIAAGIGLLFGRYWMRR